MKVTSFSIYRILLLCCIAAPMFAFSSGAEPTSLSAILITGQNNHNWRLSSPILKTILEDEGLFAVDMAVSPPEGADMSGFTPDFAAYDVVVLDYTGDPWPEPTQDAFVEYVRGGGGVVVVHAANNAFPDWPEFNEIIGLGGWGGRDERHGPYVRWRDGEIIYDMTPGPGGAHGRQHPFVVNHRNTEHPITRGLPPAWLHAQDELYHHLRGPARNMTVLATAWSAPETGGTGEHEPVLFTVRYGEGRMFQTTMGHAGDQDPPPPFQCVGFITTLRRGAEWAATGDVTQPVPDDFPGEDMVRLRPRYKAETVEGLMRELAVYQFNDSLEPLVMLEELTRRRTRMDDPLDDLEAGYLALLQSDDATYDARMFACKQLSLIGGRRSVPVLAAMILEEDTAYMARYALERIPESSALTVLREALPVVEAEHRAGIVTSLGVRGDTRSVPVISTAVHDEDPRVAKAAIRALAAIGTTDAANTLLAAIELKEGLQRQMAMDAYVQCGFEMLEARRTRDARELFEHAYGMLRDAPLPRAVALRGLIAAAGRRGGEIILDVLRGTDVEMHAVAAAAVRDVDSERVLQDIAGVLPTLASHAQVLLLTALSETDVAGISPILLGAAGSEQEDVRIAALQALGRIGDDAAALFLIQRAIVSSGHEQAAARHAISRLPRADAVILDTLATGDPALRSELLQAVIARRISEAAPILLELLTQVDISERGALLQVLAEVADPEHLEMIIPMLLAADEPEESDRIMGVVATVSERAPSAEASVATIKEALAEETESLAKKNLYTALGKIAEAEALPVLEQGLDDDDASVRLAVVKALSAWPNDAATPLVRSAMERFRSTDEGSEAIRGFIRLVGLDTDRAPEEAVALYKDALTYAERAEDKRAAMAAIGATGSEHALPVLYEALADEDEAVVLAAVQALGAWPDATPMTRLELLAKDGADTLKIEALRGYSRMIGINREISEEEAVVRYREALALAATPAEKKRIMSGLANAETFGALLVAAEYLDDPELKNEAEVAAVRIAAQVAGNHPGQVREILEQMEATTESDFIRGEIQKIYEQIARFEDYITAWEVAGPYTLDDGNLQTLFDTPFPPEAPDSDVEWRLIPVGTNDAMPFLVELDKAIGGQDRVAYVRSYVWSDTPREVVLEIGSDDGNKVWLNSELINAVHATRPVAPAQDVVEAVLREGWNALLVKVTQAGGEWSFCARFRMPDGSPVEGLRTSIRPQ